VGLHRLPARTLGQDLVQQPHRTAQPGTETTHRRRRHLPQHRLGHPPRWGPPRRTQRRNDRRRTPLHLRRLHHPAPRERRPTSLTPRSPPKLTTESHGYTTRRDGTHLPLAKEEQRLEDLKRSLAVYRLVFGQPRQEELL